MTCCLQQTHFKDKCRLRMKGWKKVFQAKGNQNTNQTKWGSYTYGHKCKLKMIKDANNVII